MSGRIGFLGPRGTFCEEAVNFLRMNCKEEWEKLPCRDVNSVLEGIGRQFERGVLPIENSIEGTVTQVLDALVSVELFITCEVIIPVQHCLMVRSRGSLAAVEAIVSHPQALAQCRGYIREVFPDAELVSATSTADAARLAAESIRPLGAIASRSAAAEWGLEIMAEGIQDSPENYTRFVVLEAKQSPPTGGDKTSIAFSLKGNSAGVLHEALGVFASRGINLSKIESRPAKRYLGEYLFFIDFAGHQEEPLVTEALAELRKQCDFYRFLGSYHTVGVCGLRQEMCQIVPNKSSGDSSGQAAC